MDDCIENIKIEDSQCLPACEGVLVTSFTRTVNSKNPEDVMGNLLEEYDHYKGEFEFPAGLKG